MNYLNNSKHNKIIYFLLLTLIFTILYNLFDDTNFRGLDKVSDVIKDEIIKEEVEEEVQDEVGDETIEKTRKNFEGYEAYIPNDVYNKKDKDIEDKAEEVDESLEKEELNKKNIKPSFYTQLFKRLYFSVSTGALLGYGDVYPNTNIVKTISMVQALSTISLIVF
tara:strand:- start:43 stop:537 length:495 start_codon:yes stop_codon:yes gene_type:complete